MSTTNWKNELKEVCEMLGEPFESLICTLSEEELEENFDSGWGGVEGKPFTAWGEKYVYFPIVYDGSEWVGYAPRNPCNIKMHHQGGC